MEEFAQALDDREAEAQPLAALAGGVVHLMVFFEDRLQLGLGDADPGVPDLDAQFALRVAGSRGAPCRAGYISGRSKSGCGPSARGGADRSGWTGRREHPQIQAGRLCVVSQFLPEAIEQVVHREVDDFRLNGPGLRSG